ncbi:MAG: lytic murein transglycosylase, partial [Pseudomonadota bacterium]
MLRRILFAIAVCLPVTAFAQSQQKSETQYQAFLQNQIWPKAKAAGVSRATFDGALKGKTLNWKIPGLVPPGSSGTPAK